MYVYLVWITYFSKFENIGTKICFENNYGKIITFFKDKNKAHRNKWNIFIYIFIEKICTSMSL